MSQDEKNFGMLCHLLALSGFIIPFGNVLGPLVMWLVKKEEFPFVDEQGKEALNFQISLTIAAIVSGVLTLILIGLLMLVIVALAGIILPIIAALKAKDGESYRYPFTLRLIK